jgi:hypothetical protein
MDCKTARRYLHLFKEDELTRKEKILLGNHLSECTSCTALGEELAIYEQTLKEIAGQEPYLSNPGLLTGNIMNGIKSEKSSLLKETTKLFRLPFFRIASSLLILIQIGAFSYQHFYIADSIRHLSPESHRQKRQNITDNNKLNTACIEESRRIITDVLGYDDLNFKRKAINIGRNLSVAEIENYAVQICQYSYRIQKTSNRRQKKKLLINILNSELNIKLDDEI